MKTFLEILTEAAIGEPHLDRFVIITTGSGRKIQMSITKYFEDFEKKSTEKPENFTYEVFIDTEDGNGKGKKQVSYNQLKNEYYRIKGVEKPKEKTFTNKLINLFR
jgi:hypothetical protein